MNWLDIVLLVLLSIPAITGLKKGLIKAVLSLAGLIIGIILAGRLYPAASRIFTFIGNENIANILGYILILVAVIGVAMLLVYLLRKLADAITIGWLDHLGGAVFGLLAGFLILGAILAIIAKYVESDLIAQSFIAQVMLDYFPIVLGLLPDDFKALQDFFQT
jgi:membrane protein required for colicin V production